MRSPAELGALEAAAKAALTPQEFEVFSATIAVTDSVQTPRNQLAHWIWGSCQELPKALLLAEPKSAKERDHELALALERADAGRLDTAEMAKLNNWDNNKIVVYRQPDLERAERDLEAKGDRAYSAFTQSSRAP